MNEQNNVEVVNQDQAVEIVEQTNEPETKEGLYPQFDPNGTDTNLLIQEEPNNPKQPAEDVKPTTVTKTKKPRVRKKKEKTVPLTPKTKPVKPAPKTSAKPAKPAPTKGKPAPKASTNGKATPAAKPAAPKKDNSGLRKPQVRILAALAKSGRPMTRVELAKAAPVDQATCVEYLGSADPEKRKANDAKHFPSLVSLGYVKQIMDDQDGSTVWVHSITATGKKALESASK